MIAKLIFRVLGGSMGRSANVPAFEGKERIRRNAAVVARYSTSKAMLYTIGWLLACAVGFAVTLHHPDGTSIKDYLNSKGAYRYEYAVVAWLCLPLLVLRQFAILNQIVFHARRGIWITGMRLHYMNVFTDFFVRSVRCEDIERAELAVRSRRDGIILALRNDHEIFISTWIFAEHRDEILARINEALRL